MDVRSRHIMIPHNVLNDPITELTKKITVVSYYSTAVDNIHFVFTLLISFI